MSVTLPMPVTVRRPSDLGGDRKILPRNPQYQPHETRILEKPKPETNRNPISQPESLEQKAFRDRVKHVSKNSNILVLRLQNLRRSLACLNMKVSDFVAEIYKEPPDPAATHQLVPLTNGRCKTSREEQKEVRAQFSCGRGELQVSATNYLRNKEVNSQIQEASVDGEIAVNFFSETVVHRKIAPTMQLRCLIIWLMATANGQLENIWALLKGDASRVSNDVGQKGCKEEN